MDKPDWGMVSAVAASVSAIAVLFAMLQLRATKVIAQLQFEDALEREYRELVARIPTKALLDSDLNEQEYRETFDEFFRYFDLSNQQAALRKAKRIGDVTWKNWRSGIQFNLKLPAFARAWSEIKSRTSDQADEYFSELRGLEQSGFSKQWPQAKGN